MSNAGTTQFRCFAGESFLDSPVAFMLHPKRMRRAVAESLPGGV